MMTLQDFLSGWPLLWPSPGHQCQAPHGPAQLDKRTPKKPLGAEDTNSWEMLRKKLLCLRGWCLILEPLNHPSVARGHPLPGTCPGAGWSLLLGEHSFTATSMAGSGGTPGSHPGTGSTGPAQEGPV